MQPTKETLKPFFREEDLRDIKVGEETIKGWLVHYLIEPNFEPDTSISRSVHTALNIAIPQEELESFLDKILDREGEHLAMLQIERDNLTAFKNPDSLFPDTLEEAIREENEIRTGRY